jgi:hypothetical protein
VSALADAFLFSDDQLTLVSKVYLLLRLVLKSIGYKSLPIEGLPFDIYRGACYCLSV